MARRGVLTSRSRAVHAYIAANPGCASTDLKREFALIPLSQMYRVLDLLEDRGFMVKSLTGRGGKQSYRATDLPWAEKSAKVKPVARVQDQTRRPDPEPKWPQAAGSHSLGPAATPPVAAEDWLKGIPPELMNVTVSRLVAIHSALKKLFG